MTISECSVPPLQGGLTPPEGRPVTVSECSVAPLQGGLTPPEGRPVTVAATNCVSEVIQESFLPGRLAGTSTPNLSELEALWPPSQGQLRLTAPHSCGSAEAAVDAVASHIAATAATLQRTHATHARMSGTSTCTHVYTGASLQCDREPKKSNIRGFPRLGRLGGGGGLQ